MGLKYINLILYTSKGCICMKKLKELFKKYNHAWVLLYALIYMPWFTYLERHVTADFYLIHSPLDDYIPFVEYFIVPYLLWFVYLAVGACFSRTSFYRRSGKWRTTIVLSGWQANPCRQR